MKIKQEAKKRYYDFRCRSKCSQFSVSKKLLEVLLDRLSMNGAEEIVQLLCQSKTKEEWKEAVLSYAEKKRNSILGQYFLLGTITGNYSFFTLDGVNCDSFDYSHFRESFSKEAHNQLRDHFYDYLLLDNKRKNPFLWDGKTYDYTLDLDKNFCLSVFDDVVSGKEQEDAARASMDAVARNYLVSMVGIYGYDTICHHFDFILYDLASSHPKDLSLEERKKEFLEKENLTDAQFQKISLLPELKKRVKEVGGEKGKDLLERIERVEPKENAIGEDVSDLFLEYETLYREDLLNHLYVPKDEVTIVEDFQDLRPQLLHLFIRRIDQKRSEFEKEMKEEINEEQERMNPFLTDREKEVEFERRKQGLDAQLDPLQANYFLNRPGYYTDASGFLKYRSDTTNQISTSIYSEKYFLNRFPVGLLGIGFNKEGVVPEAIVLSSSSYLTTNKGLNHLTYNDDDFMTFSAPYSELVSNDGRSEVVLFRRNQDYDTKASYLFLSIDSSDGKKSQESLEKAKAMAVKDKMKLVVYDLYKIRNSYKNWIQSQEELREEASIENSLSSKRSLR